MRRLVTLLIAVSLVAPFLTGFTWQAPEKCSCCTDGKLCHRTTKTSSRTGSAISGDPECKPGCAQSPAISGLGLLVLCSRSLSSGPIAPDFILPQHTRAILPADSPEFALFQRPPPSL